MLTCFSAPCATAVRSEPASGGQGRTRSEARSEIGRANPCRRHVLAAKPVGYFEGSSSGGGGAPSQY